MSSIEVQTKVLTVEQVEIKITDKILLKLLKLEGEDIKNVRVYVRVPGGGNYSNVNLALYECELVVQYDTSKNEIKSQMIDV